MDELTLVSGTLYKSRPSVLFLGRHGCSWTEEIFLLLKKHTENVLFFESRRRDEFVPNQVKDWSGDLIFSFRSFHILSPDQISRARIGAINFHPGPPEYPGSGCTNWALLNRADQFGVTAHLMAQKVDAGPIIAVDRFEIFEEDNLETLLSRTHSRLGELAIRLVGEILSLDPSGQRDFLSVAPTEQWSGKTKSIRELDKLRLVPLDISPDDLNKRIRALQHHAFPLYVKVAGQIFQLLPNDTQT